jgi:hypothetical protein
MAEPTKNEQKATISVTTSRRTANTTALAASTGSRRGTASSEARITPVEYSLVMISTPRTAMASWPRPIPVPRMKPTGSARTLRFRAAARGPNQFDSVSQAISAVKPMHTTTKMTSVQTVERTERILVHSARSRPENPAWRPVAGSAGPRAGVTGAAAVMRCSPGPPPQ